MASFALQLYIVLVSISIAAPADQPKPDKPPLLAPAGGTTVLQLAGSQDGQSFVPTGEVLSQGATRPALVRLATGDLLALYEAGKSEEASGLWASRSKDDGKTWLPPRPVIVRGLGKGERAANPDLLVMPSGLVRMYFCLEQEQQQDRKTSRAGALIGSAVTRDGVEFQIDRQVRIACPDMRSARVCAYAAEKQVVLLVAEEITGDGKFKDAGKVQQFISRDGRAFSKPDRARLAGQVGHVLQVDAHHWRMYIAGDGLIRSRMSNDGVRWRDESGVCLRAGFDPAVAVTSDKHFVMLFCSPMTAELAKAPQLAAIGNSGQPSQAAVTPSDANASQAGTSEQASSGAVPPPDSGNASQVPPLNNPGQSNSTASNDPNAGWDAFAPAGYDSELGSDWTGSGGGLTDSSTQSGSDLAPIPDFKNKVDYIDWYARNCIVPDDQNAYYSYEPVLAGAKERADQFKNMFNSEQSFWPPVPWNPTDRPEWETSHQATQDLLDQYFAAGQNAPLYSSPLRFGDKSPPGDQLLLEYLLPSLASMRNMCKQTLGDAWRAQDGQVPPEQMRGALEAIANNVTHLQQGPSLIENLVGVAERTLAEDNARWALYRGVFKSPEELQTTLNMLREKDVTDPDPGNWLRLEHAAAMDVVQYIFQPKTPDADPALRTDRVNRLLQVFGSDPPGEADLIQINKLTSDDAEAAAKAMSGYYEQMRGYYQNEYPYASADRFETMAMDINKQHGIAAIMLPSLSRANALMRRSEASRRATQLTYSVELFKAQSGRYPTSLDELPSDQVQDVRIDPYSGQDFAYRLTESGPTIYSLSENGRDDGGVHSRRWGDEKKENESDDYVFWPPQE